MFISLPFQNPAAQCEQAVPDGSETDEHEPHGYATDDDEDRNNGPDNLSDPFHRGRIQPGFNPAPYLIGEEPGAQNRRYKEEQEKQESGHSALIDEVRHMRRRKGPVDQDSNGEQHGDINKHGKTGHVMLP